MLSFYIQVLINGILRSGLYILVSVGLALAVGVIGILNFAHGEFLMLGAYLGVFLFNFAGLDPIVSLPIAAVTLFLIGATVYQLSIKKVLPEDEINQLLLTFGISIFLQNLALILWSGDPRGINVAYRTRTVSILGANVGMGRLVTFVIALLLVVILYYILSKSRLGKSIRAVSQNRCGAQLVGIEVGKVYLVAFGISAALAGIAGAMLPITLYAQPQIGLGYTLKALCIVVLAGLGNVYGVIWASLVLGISESFVGTLLPGGSGWAEGSFFIIILIALLVRHWRENER